MSFLKWLFGIKDKPSIPQEIIEEPKETIINCVLCKKEIKSSEGICTGELQAESEKWYGISEEVFYKLGVWEKNDYYYAPQKTKICQECKNLLDKKYRKEKSKKEREIQILRKRVLKELKS